MMSLDDIISLADHLQITKHKESCYLVISIDKDAPHKQVEHMIRDLKASGYCSMVRTTEFGDEIVITDKVS